jgi:hypothetical protein
VAKAAIAVRARVKAIVSERTDTGVERAELRVLDSYKGDPPTALSVRYSFDRCSGRPPLGEVIYLFVSAFPESTTAWINFIPGSTMSSASAVRPTQGKTLAVMQVSGGSQSFNAVSQMRLLGRWMRMVTIPNQSSVPKAYQEFDEAGRMRQSPLYERVVDVVEELVKFTLLTRDVAPYLVDRYSERKESADALSKRMNQGSL